MMDMFSPKIRSIICIIICVLLIIIFRFFTNCNIIIIINLLIFLFGFLISYFLAIKIDLRISNALFYVICLCSLCAINLFDNSNIALDMMINDWEKTAIKKIGNSCTSECYIKNQTIYDQSNNKLYKWDGFNVYRGTIRTVNESLEYKMSFDDKCIVKDFDKDRKVLDGNCKKNNYK